MIKENFQNILSQLPPGVELVAAAKERSVDEIKAAISAGARIIGENYVKEAKDKVAVVGRDVKWHLIGHLQKNKAKAAVGIFDMIETLDSLELAGILDQECKRINKFMPVLIEVNSAGELQKAGILPEAAEKFLKQILVFSNLKPMGLMTMGPWLDDVEGLRPYFKKTKDSFEQIKKTYGSKLDWRYLSMGMSSSWKVAVEEGTNLVRIGTAIFGERR
ncbi:MAG: YggS family pyridoxal phosphate-dependent enzyme [Candidatus Omnitrophica bacterium]|nr:YggS family pyridoxal phosphate-dependent enzyme [Candidatus Omnitrophota bacterium]MBU2250897.1 YggS family pyridoxal phosphate-dependent enzyme [Candidatus Omnitrophota bacterium]MBU2265996.1 YggS family pyridoxal phosphate-dependent enzyme [Candidatus Omnitrophota bacterium]MBU2474024.1 YggS family pyridoxal phosphate-dependent enzyme [Candidatus Omnitrophota bacterium]